MRPTVAHYRILEKLGEGGMGEVWKAKDTKLERPVALKILPLERISDPDRRRRFVQEAKAASAINHPHIVTIYEIGSEDGLEYIAMEYVAGQTLSEQIGRKGIPFAQAIPWAIQIADALGRAHARGIVHRDVKPGNVMVSESGAVKVLDFGLSKLLEPAATSEQDATATLADRPRSEEGKLVGTVAYMSPEQAEGRPVDARSDIFSFGALLYEMVSGRRPFQGDSKLSVLSSILREEPAAISSILPGVPADLEKIIGRCLRKDPARRYQHMDDVRIALEDLKAESESGIAAPGVAKRRRSPWLAAALVAVAAAAAFAIWRLPRSTPTHAGAPALARLTYDSGLTTDAAISPDGRLLAYASDRAGQGGLDIWVRQLAGGDPTRITNGPEDEYEPQFSPDGTRLAYRSDAAGGAIYTIPALGGQPRLIAPQGRGPRYSPDGHWIAYWKGNPTGGTPYVPGAATVWVIRAEGGQARQLAADFWVAARPEWTADGKHIVFWGLPDASHSRDFYVAPFDGGPAVKTGAAEIWSQQQLHANRGYEALVRGASNRYYLTLVTSGIANLWTIQLSTPAWKAADLRRLTNGTQAESQPAISGDRVAFTAETDSVQIWSIKLDANRGEVSGAPEQLTHGDEAYIPVLSRDGKKLSYVSFRPGEERGVVRDLDSNVETVVASGATVHHPVLSPDGDRVAYVFRSVRSDRPELQVTPSGGGAAQKLQCEGCGMTLGWTNDGGQILVKKGNDIGLLDVAGGRLSILLHQAKDSLWQPQISPDGRWIAFLDSADQEHSTIYVAPYRPGTQPAEWIAVTTSGTENDKPRWSPDGQILYFTSTRDGFRCIWAQRLNPGTNRPVGDPIGILHFHSSARSLSNVDLYKLEMSVAAGRLLFVLGERRGNLWTAPTGL